MDDEDTELRNPYPSPPSHYAKYTSHNLHLLALLHDRAADPQNSNQYEILSDQSDIPDWSLTQLEKPRVDWILDEEEPYYDVFGDRWFVRAVLLACYYILRVLATGERENSFSGGIGGESTLSG